MSDPQGGAESLDEDELPGDLIPENFIEPEDWDAGAGAAPDAAIENESGIDADESEIGQEREGELAPEEAAMHVERGTAVE
ncbi:MAG: hypothetical protein QOJ00_1420 [Actinomycetota bacterium]